MEGSLALLAPTPEGAPARLRGRLIDLANLGERRCGSAAGRAAASLIAGRLQAAGLCNVRQETFAFPDFALRTSSLFVDEGAGSAPLSHEALAYSGAGSAEGELVAVGTGEPPDYQGLDVQGRIVLVERNATYHRSAQLREAVARGAVGLLFMSHAPSNLIQRGTISDPEDGLGPIPCLSIGERDGRALTDGLRSGRPIRARLEVDAGIVPAEGQNVIAELPGRSSEVVLIGAHYDSWHAGASDNGTGVAALIELAERLAGGGDLQRTLVFAAWDGEELGLFGGYDWLRRHVVLRGAQLRAFVNLEIPAAGKDDLRALAYAGGAGMHVALQQSGLLDAYPIAVGMEQVPGLFGGVIPTDIQGHYRTGHAGLCTACESPWYHTAGDTPEKVDVVFLAQAVAAFEETIRRLAGAEPPEMSADPALWPLEMQAATQGGELRLTLKTEAHGQVDLWVCADDFTRVWKSSVQADAQGFALATVPAKALRAGSRGRWLHATAGRDWPLAERIVALP